MRPLLLVVRGHLKPDELLGSRHAYRLLKLLRLLPSRCGAQCNHVRTLDDLDCVQKRILGRCSSWYERYGARERKEIASVDQGE